jgi:hypothetical protein
MSVQRVLKGLTKGGHIGRLSRADKPFHDSAILPDQKRHPVMGRIVV